MSGTSPIWVASPGPSSPAHATSTASVGVGLGPATVLPASPAAVSSEAAPGSAMRAMVAIASRFARNALHARWRLRHCRNRPDGNSIAANTALIGDATDFARALGSAAGGPSSFPHSATYSGQLPATAAAPALLTHRPAHASARA